MKTLLEVFVNDEGKLDLRFDNESYLDERFSLRDLKQSQIFFRESLSRLIDLMWKDRNTCISKVIRLLSMLEMCACAEPYAQAEDFWAMMMFDCIPATEEFADSLKQKYGYDPRSKTKPFTMGDVSAFRIGPHNGMN